MVRIAIRIWRLVLLLLVLLGRPLGAEAELGLQQMRLGGSLAVSVGDTMPLVAWDRALHGIARDRARIAACLRDSGCVDGPASWIAERLRPLRGLTARHQIEAVNALINEVPYAADRPGGDDWQTPLLFLSGSGDCEDYAIAKYVALLVLGFDEEHLRLVVVEDVRRSLPHALLIVDGPDSSWLLDNLRGSVTTALPDAYRPIYAVSRLDRWVFAPAD